MEKITIHFKPAEGNPDSPFAKPAEIRVEHASGEEGAPDPTVTLLQGEKAEQLYDTLGGAVRMAALDAFLASKRAAIEVPLATENPTQITAPGWAMNCQRFRHNFDFGTFECVELLTPETAGFREVAGQNDFYGDFHERGNYQFRRETLVEYKWADMRPA